VGCGDIVAGTVPESSKGLGTRRLFERPELMLVQKGSERDIWLKGRKGKQRTG